MNKIYKINGKEIQGFQGRWDGTAEGKINELLEALSDKEEPKPEECKLLCLNCFNKEKGLKEDITLGLSECDYCKGVEQSTSLKEEIYQILDNHFGGFETFNNNIPTEQIISLLQSYLLKEIEDKDFAAVNRHCFDGRVVDLEDIIKIINNIC